MYRVYHGFQLYYLSIVSSDNRLSRWLTIYTETRSERGQKPGISQSIAGIKVMQLGRKRLVFRVKFKQKNI